MTTIIMTRSLRHNKRYCTNKSGGRVEFIRIDKIKNTKTIRSEIVVSNFYFFRPLGGGKFISVIFSDFIHVWWDYMFRCDLVLGFIYGTLTSVIIFDLFLSFYYFITITCYMSCDLWSSYQSWTSHQDFLVAINLVPFAKLSDLR